ncbi:hypothetical protein ACROYT_G001810 [Oculina patagonica]
MPGTKHLNADKVRGHLRDLVEDAMSRRPSWKTSTVTGVVGKKVLQLAKYFKEKSKERWYPLASYHLKTILLHMNDERRQSRDWAQGMLVQRFTELIERLLKRLRSRELYSFFMPSQNLFEGKKDLTVALHDVEDFLKTLRANPQALLR